jgi:hypothetical protein
MPGAPAAKRRLGGFSSAAILVGAWIVAILAFDHSRVHHLRSALEDVIVRVLSGFPGMQEVGHRLLATLEDSLAWTYGLSLMAATFAVPMAFVVRMIARSRLRAGHADPLDRVRSWLSARPRRAAAALAIPVVFQTHYALALWHPDWNPLYVVAAALVGGLAQLLVVRAALRALLAPTLDGGREVAIEIGTDELRFNAVAVTRETRMAVGTLALVSLAMIGWLASLPMLALFKDPRVFAAIGAYVAVAAGSALLFRVASRISVGVDGVYVGGTSRARFFAYRDLDEARLHGGDIQLVRGGRIVLRLQLHGDDALRREAILARIHEALSRVKDVERDAAANFVTSRPSDKVVKSLRGGGDYRMPSVSHDALWSLVEGAAVGAATRTAAARALARTGTSEPERARLRVAAAHCADPQVRVVLERLATPKGLEDEEREVVEAVGARASRASSLR